MKTNTFCLGISIFALTAGLGQAETLTVLVDEVPESITMMEAVIAAYAAAHPDVSIDLEIRPGSGGGDNLIKTRLATGEMPDVFVYNSGSLFQALNPAVTLMPLDDLPGQDNVSDSFKSAVTGSDGAVYGVPFGPAMAGGIFYNRAIYADLGLEVPRSWDALIANAQAAEEAGLTGIAQTFGTVWTSQLLVLSDYYNVQAADPDFATLYTANQAKYATSEAAFAGFRHMQQLYDLGLMNADAGAASFEEGMEMVASGEAAHYPMLTYAVGQVATNLPENLDDLGFFAQPGASAEHNGLTVWMPTGLFIPAAAANPERARDFVNFVASVPACEAMIAAAGATGPYLIKGCNLPADVPPAIAEMLPYFQMEGGTAPALEFLSPIKGPNLENLLVEVGTGIRSAEDAAALYDLDVVKQARQLGLSDW